MDWNDKVIIFKVLVWCGIYGAIGGFWEFMELVLYGETMPSYEDSVIAVITTFAIYKLLMKWVTFKG